jgi:hypothetical protein
VEDNMEKWAIIVGTEGRYSISDHGRVRANWRDVPQRNSKKRLRIDEPHMLTPYLHTTSYLRVSLGRKNYRYVHRLVALAFIPNPENKPFVDHIDGDRTNNVLSNLRWVTGRENSVYGGERHRFKSQIAASKRRAIHVHRAAEYRALLDSGVSLRQIAKKYNTSHSAISYALRAEE